mmetsp:Transcript_19200/g.46316  ORF Transcript_19200/g.46316 Transcript_19200/m.46316 type:complete len:353 (-) Transcript_19200:383-1441(-)
MADDAAGHIGFHPPQHDGSSPAPIPNIHTTYHALKAGEARWAPRVVSGVLWWLSLGAVTSIVLLSLGLESYAALPVCVGFLPLLILSFVLVLRWLGLVLSRPESVRHAVEVSRVLLVTWKEVAGLQLYLMLVLPTLIMLLLRAFGILLTPAVGVLSPLVLLGVCHLIACACLKEPDVNPTVSACAGLYLVAQVCVLILRLDGHYTAPWTAVLVPTFLLFGVVFVLAVKSRLFLIVRLRLLQSQSARTPLLAPRRIQAIDESRMLSLAEEYHRVLLMCRMATTAIVAMPCLLMATLIASLTVDGLIRETPDLWAVDGVFVVVWLAVSWKVIAYWSFTCSPLIHSMWAQDKWIW